VQSPREQRITDTMTKTEVTIIAMKTEATTIGMMITGVTIATAIGAANTVTGPIIITIGDSSKWVQS
jgi:hypothetical protein